ncbi:permease prefix domain 1-containing protein [Agromyces sp. NPDC058484]|uniref:permease prefix domain 1-containing protein n=1 Tax=Agromyces sp. NPDC058484 TaxID=3346524 RepID=UPI003661D62D
MTTLTDRYVWAAARSVPEAQRDEFDRELRERIGDAVDARLAASDGTTATDAERAALVDLGDPAALAATYVDRPLQLIGPRYFLTWWRLLKMLLVIVVPIAAAGVLLGQIISGANLGEMIGTTITTALAVVVHLGFWTTVVFAMLERSAGAAMPLATWTPEQLPQPRDDARAGRLGDLIASVVFLALFAAAIVWQQFGVVWLDGERQAIPVLDPDLWSLWIPYFLGLIVLEVVFAVVIYLRGWSWTMAGLNVLLNIAFTVPALWLFLSGQLLDPAFVEAVGWPWSDDASTPVVAVILVVVIGVTVWDIVDGFLKAARSRGGSALGGY